MFLLSKLRGIARSLFKKSTPPTPIIPRVIEVVSRSRLDTDCEVEEAEIDSEFEVKKRLTTIYEDPIGPWPSDDLNSKDNAVVFDFDQELSARRHAVFIPDADYHGLPELVLETSPAAMTFDTVDTALDHVTQTKIEEADLLAKKKRKHRRAVLTDLDGIHLAALQNLPEPPAQAIKSENYVLANTKRQNPSATVSALDATALEGLKQLPEASAQAKAEDNKILANKIKVVRHRRAGRAVLDGFTPVSALSALLAISNSENVPSLAGKGSHNEDNRILNKTPAGLTCQHSRRRRNGLILVDANVGD